MGQGMSFGGTTLTYLEPTANWLMMLLLLTLAVTTIHRVPTDRWIRWGSAFAFAALLLSFRRSFWIGAALGFVLILLFATGRRGGRVLLPTVIIIAIASVITLVLAGSSNSSNPIVARGKALSPSADLPERGRPLPHRGAPQRPPRRAQRPVFGLGHRRAVGGQPPISLDFTGHGSTPTSYRSGSG